MRPNDEQIKSALRTLVQVFGSMMAGWFAAKGYFTIDQVETVLNSPAIIGVFVSILMGIWGLFVHSTTNAVAIVAAMPQVAGVVTVSTVEGTKLANSIAGPDVATAGTQAAANIAKK